MPSTVPHVAAGHSNNFDFLRLAAAVAVIVGHAWVLAGRPGDAPVVFGIPIHGVGVAIFFVISGYLIAGSWLRHPEPAIYISSRAARILPALVLVVVVSAFVVGPIFTTLPLGQYFGGADTYRYLANMLPFVPQYDLPGVFESLPYPAVVNGSLWTLRAEIACYILIGMLGVFSRRFRMPVVVAFGTIAAIAALMSLVVAGSDVSAAATTWAFFAGGAIVRMAVPRSALRLDVAFGVLVVWAALSAFTPVPSYILAWVALPYCLLAFGLAATPVLRRAARFGDLSYGVYLWAFPIQQATLTLSPGIPMPVNLVVVTVLSACCAFVSWHLVESPAMKAKDRLPWVRSARLAARASRGA